MPTESAPALPKPEWNARGVRGTVVPSRRGLPGLVVCAFLLLTGLVGCAMAQPPRTGPSLGMNLSGPADWNTELPFVDVFRMSRERTTTRPSRPSSWRRWAGRGAAANR
jgi:hypothetical protein